jgi:hypothetical protein
MVAILYRFVSGSVQNHESYIELALILHYRDGNEIIAAYRDVAPDKDAKSLRDLSLPEITFVLEIVLLTRPLYFAIMLTFT